MLVAERYKKILELVNQRGSIRVAELSRLCNVTEETIRRDLDRLENEGKLRRSHGGAVRIEEDTQELPFAEREITNAEQKRQIAREAVKYIQPGDRILLDASSTAWYTASILPNIELTVVTNSIKVALELAGKERVQVISIGGALHRKSMSYVGPLAERSLDNYRVDKTFFSCRGVHLEWGLSDSNEQHASLKAKMMQVADRVVLLADSSKFGTQAFAQLGTLDQVHAVITDGGIDAGFLEKLREKVPEVVLVD